MRKIYDPMEFQPGMQQIDSDIFDRVIAARKAYQSEQYGSAGKGGAPEGRIIF